MDFPQADKGVGKVKRALREPVSLCSFCLHVAHRSLYCASRNPLRVGPVHPRRPGPPTMPAFLRVAAVAVIFYLSPLRPPLDRPLRGQSRAEPEGPRLAGPSPSLDKAEALWRSQPDVAKEALGDRLQAELSGPAPANASASVVAARDTLEPEDLQPPWRGEGMSAAAPSLAPQARPDPKPQTRGRAQRAGPERPRL
jgi:hypothetical protein